MQKPDDSIKLFISYAHEDEAFLVQLEKHLASLKREHLISTWYDRKILPGERWEKQIDRSLETADVALFLVSPDFVASDYCQGREVKVALERHEQKKLIVVPLVIRPVDWLHTPLGAIQGIPKDGKAISTWEDRDLGWLDCIHRLRLLVQELIAREHPTTLIIKRPRRFQLQEALTSAVEELDFRYNSDAEIGGVPTGLHDLDRLIDGCHPCDVICIASPNPSDKTNFLLNIANYVATDASLPAALFSTKHTKEDIGRKLMAICGHLSPHSLQRGSILDEDWGRLIHAIQKLNEATLTIYDEPEVHIDSLEEEIKEFSSEAGRCALVAIDSFENIIGATQSEILRRLSRLSKSLKTTIAICAELTRDTTNRLNKRPLPGDLGQVSQFVDFVLFVYRDEIYNPDTSERGTAEIIVAKNARGAVGTIKVSHLGWTGKFSNLTSLSTETKLPFEMSAESADSEKPPPHA